MILNMFEYYNMFKEKNIHIIYSGPVWTDGVEELSLTLKKRLAFDGLPLSTSQSVFSVFVEQMNNMLMYSEEKESLGADGDTRLNVSKGIFALGSTDKTYFVQSGNVIKNENIEIIKKRIDYLNTLDKKELRQYYREKIKSENTNPESKGGGIGLIEIARRADGKIEYDFRPYADGLAFFTIFVKIGKGEN